MQPATQMPSPFTSPLPHHKSWNQAFATWNHDASIWTFAAKWLQSTCLKTGPSQPQSTETGTPHFWSPKFLLSLGIWRSWRLVQNVLSKFKDIQTYFRSMSFPVWMQRFCNKGAFDTFDTSYLLPLSFFLGKRLAMLFTVLECQQHKP